MSSRDRDRAKEAYRHVEAVAAKKDDEAFKKKYATFVHKLPALLNSAGLCQSLHFIQSRNEKAGVELLSHLAAQLHRVDQKIKEPKDLLDAARTADLSMYLFLTREAMACAAWYRRMVQGVLKIDDATAGEE